MMKICCHARCISKVLMRSEKNTPSCAHHLCKFAILSRFMCSCFQVNASTCQSSDRIERIKRQIFDLIEGEEEVQDSVPKKSPTKSPQQVWSLMLYLLDLQFFLRPSSSADSGGTIVSLWVSVHLRQGFLDISKKTSKPSKTQVNNQIFDKLKQIYQPQNQCQ